MFGNEVNRYNKKSNKPEVEKEEDDDLEAYLRARNATIGEKTKSIAESKEDKAMAEYLRLRSKTYGEEGPVQPAEKKAMEEDDIDSYLAERNKTLNEELSPKEQEDAELEAYMRERRNIIKD